MLHLAGVEIPEHFEGQPFAGVTCAPRQFAFSNRNRMDQPIDFEILRRSPHPSVIVHAIVAVVVRGV
jgi:hypothetical protein